MFVSPTTNGPGRRNQPAGPLRATPPLLGQKPAHSALQNGFRHTISGRSRVPATDLGFRQAPHKYNWPPHMDLEVRKAGDILISLPTLEPVNGNPNGHPEYRQAAEFLFLYLQERSHGHLLKDGQSAEALHWIGTAIEVEKSRQIFNMPFYVTWAAIFHDAVEDRRMSMDEVRDVVWEAGHHIIGLPKDEALLVTNKVLTLVHMLTRPDKLMELQEHTVAIFSYEDNLRILHLEPQASLIKVCDLRDRHKRLPDDKESDLYHSEQVKTLQNLRIIRELSPVPYRERLHALLLESAQAHGLC